MNSPFGQGERYRESIRPPITIHVKKQMNEFVLITRVNE